MTAEHSDTMCSFKKAKVFYLPDTVSYQTAMPFSQSAVFKGTKVWCLCLIKKVSHSAHLLGVSQDPIHVTLQVQHPGERPGRALACGLSAPLARCLSGTAMHVECVENNCKDLPIKHAENEP